MTKKSNEERTLIGYCHDCKDPIFDDENYHKTINGLECDFCYKAKHPEVLNFE